MNIWEGSCIGFVIINFTFSPFWVSSIMFSQVTTLFDALDKEGQIQDYQALINQEENTEMTPIIVTN